LNPKNFTREQAIEIWEAQDWKCIACGCDCGDEENMYVPHHIVFKSQMTSEHMENGRVKTSNGEGRCPVCHSAAHGIEVV